MCVCETLGVLSCQGPLIPLFPSPLSFRDVCVHHSNQQLLALSLLRVTFVVGACLHDARWRVCRDFQATDGDWLASSVARHGCIACHGLAGASHGHGFAGAAAAGEFELFHRPALHLSAQDRLRHEVAEVAPKGLLEDLFVGVVVSPRTGVVAGVRRGGARTRARQLESVET